MNEEEIIEEIARLFDCPCDNGLDAYMYENAVDWCETYCGKCSSTDCWRKYFEIKAKEQKEKSNGQ